MILQFPSIAAMRQTYIDRNCDPYEAGSRGNSSWYNDESAEDTLRFAQLGDIRLVDKAEEAVSKLDAILETPRNMWQPNVAGAYCSVPDYLSGRPTNMRRLVHSTDEHAPITIISNMASSAGVSAATLEKRGTIILALVIALSRIRPVELWVMSTGNGNDKDKETVVMAQVNTHPLDLATSCYVLTSCGFCRRIAYAVKKTMENGYSHMWPLAYNPTNPTSYNEALKLRLGLDPKRSLVIAGAHLYDELVVSPIPWLNKQIAYFTNVNETETTP